MKIKNQPVKFKAGPDDGLEEGEFIVYPSTFTRQPDSYGDVVAKGAFAETIAEWNASGNSLPGLYGHRLDDPDFFVAGAAEMTEDDHGWRVKGRRLNQLSFAYDVLDEGQVELEDGTKANELRKLKVYEFSFVPIGANQDTSVVAVKSTTDALMADLKTGTLTQKHIDSLRSAQEAIGVAIAAAEAYQEKASEQATATTQEPSRATVQEPKSDSSVNSLAATIIAIHERDLT